MSDLFRFRIILTKCYKRAPVPRRSLYIRHAILTMTPRFARCFVRINLRGRTSPQDTADRYPSAEAVLDALAAAEFATPGFEYYHRTLSPHLRTD